VKVKGREYSIENDLTWRELITVEELSGTSLGADGALDSMTVSAALIFVILKREDKALTWDGFMDQSIGDLETSEGDDTADGPGENGGRPTKAAKRAASAPRG